jgi:hypothetical protein
MSFQKTVLTTATVILIISLIVVAIILKVSNANTKYPPEIAICPDYFIPKSQNVCSNPKGLGNNLGDEVTFEGDSACGRECNKRNHVSRCRWANTNGIQWDGITNRNLC